MNTPLASQSEKRRILLHVLPSFGVGGVPVRVAQIANHFKGKYAHHIVALDGDYQCCERLNEDVICHQVPFEFTSGSTLRNAWRFRRQIKALNPDVFITYNWGAVEMALSNWFPLRPHIHVEDGFGPDEAECQLRRRVMFRHFVLAYSHKVVVPSRSLYDIAINVWRLHPRRVQYVPNGIDCARFLQAPDREILKRLGLSNDRLIVGTVAALRTEKNLARLVRAFAEVVRQIPAKLLIVGDGPERSNLESNVAQAGLSDSVVFAGHIQAPERLLRAFDVFALSSDTEQMPYTVLEAMAAGLPVASVDVGDVRHMVSTENLPFIAPRTDSALASSLTTLLQDARIRHHVGGQNRTRVEMNYDQQQMLHAYDQLLSA